jgi:hypothetical protein
VGVVASVSQLQHRRTLAAGEQLQGQPHLLKPLVRSRLRPRVRSSASA